MPWHTPERKSEQALKTYFETILTFEVADVQIATRFSNTDLTEPRIEIYCTECEPWSSDVAPYPGNWICNLTLKIISHYDEGGTDAEAHDNIVGNLLDQLLIVDDNGDDAAASQINAVLFDVDLFVILVDVGSRTNTIDEHSLITEQELVLYVKPSNQGDT